MNDIQQAIEQACHDFILEKFPSFLQDIYPVSSALEKIALCEVYQLIVRTLALYITVKYYKDCALFIVRYCFHGFIWTILKQFLFSYSRTINQSLQSVANSIAGQ